LSDRWIHWVLRHHRVILLAAGILTVVAGVLATRLVVNGDLRGLLPADHAVVRGLEQIESTFGSINTVNVVAKHGTAEDRHAFTDALEARLHGHPLFRDVEHGLPTEFFAERALYYLEDEELTELEQRVDAWTHYQLCSKQPDACLTTPDPGAPDALRAFIEDKRDRSQERTGFRGRYEREGIDAEVMLIHPYEPANRLEVAKAVTLEIRALTREVYEQPDAPWAGSGMTYNLTGPYVSKADEQETILRDMVRSGIFAFVGVVLILYLLFRSNRAVLVLLVPLMLGVIWSLAATQIVLGHLNVMTSTISTVVMGVGIDAGIHFLSRARRARLEHDDGEAIRRAFDGLVAPLLVASSTTIGAFLCMASSDFPAFREFGIISALGVALCLLAMVTVLPALCFLVGIKKRGEPSPVAERPYWATRFMLERPGLVFIGLVAVSVLALQGARQVNFEYNGRSLQSDRARQNSEPDAKLVSSIFGKDIHASVLVRPTLEEARATLELARERHAARMAAGGTVVADLFAAPDLLPAPELDMQARAQWIAGFKSEHGELLDELRERAGLPPREPPVNEIPEDAERWDEWDDEDGGEPSPASPAQPGQIGDEWDEWDGEDEPGLGAAPTKPAEPAKKGEPTTPAEPAKGEPSPAAPAQGEPTTPAEPAPAKIGPPAAAPVKGEPAEPTELSTADAELLLSMFDAQPFTIDDLPPTLLGKVRASDGSYGVFVYPAFDVADMQKGMVFMEETTSYLADPEEGIFVGEAVVYAAMYMMLVEEAPAVLALASVLIALLVYWQLRSIPLTLLTLVPLALAMWWMLGVMGAVDLRFNLFNMPILPAILGIGIDNGVYLTDKIRHSPSGTAGLSVALQETGGAILAATATTAVGFAAFLVADSGGVRGIGSLAVLGISLAALTALLVLPTVNELLQRRRR
jgi:predicted RND superfamily exporter protein